MIKEKDFNGQNKYKKSMNSPKKENKSSKKLSPKKITKLKVNLSCSLKYINKKKNVKIENNIISMKNLSIKILSKNLQKHNSNPKIKNVMIISNLINCKSNHFLATFKDYLIIDYIEEFLRRIYSLNESIDRIPKLFNYYKNYLLFFCKPTFNDSFSNMIIKNYGDFHAENFYKNNIEKKNNIRGKDNDNIYVEDNKRADFIKTVFTKSIKKSIDNINNEESSIKKSKINDIIDNISNKIHEESTIRIEKNNNEIISEENSLILMINEMKNKEKMKEKRLNMKKSLSKNKNFTIDSYKTLIINNNVNKKNDNNNNKKKMNTYSNIKHIGSVKNLIYSKKPKKLTKLKIKKNMIKNEKIKQRNQNISTNKNNHNSIVVNINININTNENGNIINENKYKSPKNNPIKKRFPLSPLSPLNLNILSEKDFTKRLIPSSSRRNKDKIKTSNYIKIMKKKKKYDNLMILTTTSRNKKKFDLKKIKSLNSLEIDCKTKQNKSVNKEILCYNKIKSPKKIKYRNNNDLYVNKNNFEFYTRYTTINKTIYSSIKNFEFKTNYTKSLKNLEKVKEIKNKRNICPKMKNNVIYSPLKKSSLEKKYFSYKRLDNKNINNTNSNVI